MYYETNTTVGSPQEKTSCRMNKYLHVAQRKAPICFIKAVKSLNEGHKIHQSSEAIHVGVDWVL